MLLEDFKLRKLIRESLKSDPHILHVEEIEETVCELLDELCNRLYELEEQSYNPYIVGNFDPQCLLYTKQIMKIASNYMSIIEYKIDDLGRYATFSNPFTLENLSYFIKWANYKNKKSIDSVNDADLIELRKLIHSICHYIALNGQFDINDNNANELQHIATLICKNADMRVIFISSQFSSEMWGFIATCIDDIEHAYSVGLAIQNKLKEERIVNDDD